MLLEIRSKFVSLQIEMKGVMTKVAALLLIVWYSMSIIGFGVHTCNGSGKSFVVSFVEGFSCEDIHPEHHCSKSSCCGHSHGCCDADDMVSLKSKSCCSSEYQMLTLTGTISDEKTSGDDPISFVYCHSIIANIFEINADLYSPQFLSRCLTHDSWPESIADRQSVLSVWRI